MLVNSLVAVESPQKLLGFNLVYNLYFRDDVLLLVLTQNTIDVPIRLHEHGKFHPTGRLVLLFMFQTTSDFGLMTQLLLKLHFSCCNAETHQPSFLLLRMASLVEFISL